MGWADDRKGHLLLAVVARGGVPGGWAGDAKMRCSYYQRWRRRGRAIVPCFSDTATGSFSTNGADPLGTEASRQSRGVLVRAVKASVITKEVSAPPASVVAEKRGLDKARHFYGECVPVLDDDDQARDATLWVYVDGLPPKVVLDC